ncbi:hypothetical protein ID875_06630 [Streptomyces globisporus]|uniref:Uncharacterized protein n=1 Tax=Streptomyces globisporus TaxID=1908 RepID=A0A927BK13_STRGL|nr:hypothetical protein [Streptomyces globisporus]
MTAGEGSRSPAAAADSVGAAYAACRAIARYVGLPAVRRSVRRSWANRWTGPAAGSSGFSERPTATAPSVPRERN